MNVNSLSAIEPSTGCLVQGRQPRIRHQEVFPHRL